MDKGKRCWFLQFLKYFFWEVSERYRRDIREGKKETGKVWKKANEVNRSGNTLFPVLLEDVSVIYVI